MVIKEMHTFGRYLKNISKALFKVILIIKRIIEIVLGFQMPNIISIYIILFLLLSSIGAALEFNSGIRYIDEFGFINFSIYYFLVYLIIKNRTKIFKNKNYIKYILRLNMLLTMVLLIFILLTIKEKYLNSYLFFLTGNYFISIKEKYLNNYLLFLIGIYFISNILALKRINYGYILAILMNCIAGLILLLYAKWFNNITALTITFFDTIVIIGNYVFIGITNYLTIYFYLKI